MTFTEHALPYCVFSRGADRPRIGAGLGTHIIDLERAFGDKIFAEPSLNSFMARGPRAWQRTRERLLGFIRGGQLTDTVPIDEFADHVFGVVLLIDWSARDIQAFESRPLGPFLAKSFATTISPWVIPLAALEQARVAPPRQDPPPLGCLRASQPWGLDIELTVSINGQPVSRPRFATVYWTAAQQLAHLTVNGAALRTGDLYGSGTVSGFRREEMGSLPELTAVGREPLLLHGDQLRGGQPHGYLADGDTVTLSGSAPGPAGSRIEFGCATGRITAAADHPEVAADPGSAWNAASAAPGVS